MAQRRRRNRKWLKRIFLTLLIVAAVAVAYLVWDNYFNDNEEAGAPEPQPSVPTVVETEIELGKGGESEPVEEKEKVTQYEGEDPNMAEGLTGVITYAGVTDGVLMVRVNIDQYVGNGECGLSLRQNGIIIYSDTAEIMDSAATATCAGFNVPTSGFNAGATEIMVRLSSGDKSGEIRGEVTL